MSPRSASCVVEGLAQAPRCLEPLAGLPRSHLCQAADDSEERATGVISTYVDADSHWTLEQLGREDPDESPETMLAYSSGSSDLTSVARKMRQLNSSKKAVFNRKMSHAEKELYQDSAFSRMQVVFSGQDGDEEMLLCVIKVYQGKGEATVLEMRPGFNTPEEPTHRINQNGCTYDLCVELVSEQTGTADPDEDRSQMQRQKERNERIQVADTLAARCLVGRLYAASLAAVTCCCRNRSTGQQQSVLRGAVCAASLRSCSRTAATLVYSSQWCRLRAGRGTFGCSLSPRMALTTTTVSPSHAFRLELARRGFDSVCNFFNSLHSALPRATQPSKLAAMPVASPPPKTKQCAGAVCAAYVEYCWQLPSRWQLNKEMLGEWQGACVQPYTEIWCKDAVLSVLSPFSTLPRPHSALACSGCPLRGARSTEAASLKKAASTQVGTMAVMAPRRFSQAARRWQTGATTALTFWASSLSVTSDYQMSFRCARRGAPSPSRRTASGPSPIAMHRILATLPTSCALSSSLRRFTVSCMCACASVCGARVCVHV